MRSTDDHDSRRRRRAGAFALALLGAACTNFGTVREGGLYRMAQPAPGELGPVLDRLGIRTVIRLRGGEPGRADFDASRDPVVERGLAFVHLPMSARRLPTREELIALVDALATAEPPVLVHCRAGADRTGLAASIWRLLHGEELDAAGRSLTILHGHTGFQGTWHLDEVLEAYRPHAAAMDFATWARELYVLPELAELR